MYPDQIFPHHSSPYYSSPYQLTLLTFSPPETYNDYFPQSPSLEGESAFDFFDHWTPNIVGNLTDGSASPCGDQLSPSSVHPLPPTPRLVSSSPPTAASPHTPPKRQRQKIDPLKDTRPRPFVCDTCGVSCLRRQDLNRHKATHLNGTKPFSCDHCGIGFTRQDALQRHRKAQKCRLRPIIKRPIVASPTTSSPTLATAQVSHHHSPISVAPSSGTCSTSTASLSSPSSSPSSEADQPPSHRWQFPASGKPPAKRWHPYRKQSSSARRNSA